MTGVSIGGPLTTLALTVLLYGGIWAYLSTALVRGAVVGLRTGDWATPFVLRADGTRPLPATGRGRSGDARPVGRDLGVRWAVWSVLSVLGGFVFLARAVDAARPVAGRWRELRDGASAGSGTLASADLGAEGAVVLLGAVGLVVVLAVGGSLLSSFVRRVRRP